MGELGETPERVDVRYELRYEGQSFELTVEGELGWGDGFGGGVVPLDDWRLAESAGKLDPAPLLEAFEEAHERRYGYRDERAGVELVTCACRLWGRGRDRR